MIKFDIVKTRVTAQIRKLNVSWTKEPFVFENFPVKTIRPKYDADNGEHCWGVHLPYCRSQDMLNYMDWCDEAIDGYEMDGMGRRFWFKRERDLTMFLLRWS